jgi:hypothetical protein
MTIRFTNRASALLVSPLPSGGTDAVVEAGKGDLFPAVGGGDYAPLILTNLSGTSEIVHLTGKAGDHLTVLRAQEGAAEVAWDTGARIELRLTAGTLGSFLQTSGGVMSGAIDMGGNQILNASFPTGSLNFDTIVAQRFRGAPVQAANQIVIPSNGEHPTAGGSMILTAAMMASAIFPWSGSVVGLPSYFQLCDGTNGTPDLRDRFIVGVGPKHAAGSASATTDTTVASAAAGQHDHGGATAGYKLLPDDLPTGSYVNDVFSTGISATENMIMGSGTNRGLHVDGTDSIGQAHKHGIAAADAHQHQVDVQPPWYALAYVMFKPGV